MADLADPGGGVTADELERQLAAIEAAEAAEPAPPPPAPAAPARTLTEQAREDAAVRPAEVAALKASAAAKLPAPVQRLASSVLERRRPPLRHYTTGLRGVDERLHRARPGIYTRALHVVIARTGAGKTGFALGVLLANARAGVPGLYLGSELDADEAAIRLGALALGRPWGALEISESGRDEARAAIAGLPIAVVGADAMQERGEKVGLRIISEIQAATRAHGIPPVVVVDYLQLLPSSASDPRAGVGDMANGLRALSQVLDCCVIAVSSSARSMYRGPAERGDADDPLAYLAAAKESGDVEYAAASILYLDVDGEAGAGGVYPARVVVAKARRGSVGFVGARFEGPSGRWSEDVTIAAAMTADARTARREQRQHAEDDAGMMAAIEGAAREGVHRTATDWRGRGVLAQRRSDAAIARLVEGGRCTLLPDPRGNAASKGLVCPSDMVPPVAPINRTSIAAGYLVRGASA